MAQRARDWFAEVGWRLASQPFGQAMFRRLDDLLWTIEKSIEWSVQATHTSENKPLVAAVEDVSCKLAQPAAATDVSSELARLTADADDVTCELARPAAATDVSSELARPTCDDDVSSELTRSTADADDVISELARSAAATDVSSELAQPTADDDVSSGHIRPLPWLLFIPFLLLIRGVRLFLDLTSIVFKRDQVKPRNLVRYVQGVRRHLRAIRRRFRPMAIENENETSPLSDPPINGGATQTRSSLNKKHTQEKRNFAEIEPESSEDETTKEKLDRLGRKADEDDHSDDPDFVPNSSLDTNESLSGSDDSDDSDEESANLTLVPMQTGIPRQASTISNDIIEEEPEDDVDDESALYVSEEDDEQIVINGLSTSVDKDKFFSPIQSDGELDQVDVKPQQLFDSLGLCKKNPTDTAIVQSPECFTKSEYDSLSTKSEEFLSAKNSLGIDDMSDKSNDSAMKKLSNFFPKRKKPTPQNSV